MPDDIIRVNDILANVRLTAGARWPSKDSMAVLQPLYITISIHHSVQACADNDDLNASINYSTVVKTVRGSIDSSSTSIAFESLEHVARHILESIRMWTTHATVRLVQLRPPLYATSAIVEVATKDGKCHRILHSCQGIDCHIIVGVNPAERVEKQLVRFTASVLQNGIDLDLALTLDFRALLRHLYESISKTSYLTLEALASFIALETLQQISKSSSGFSCPLVTVNVRKPWAIVLAESAEVEISRAHSDYPDVFSQSKLISTSSSTSDSSRSMAIIALGSNLGDRFQNIEAAARLLEHPRDVMNTEDMGDLDLDPPLVVVTNTSFMYETPPMYMTDQPTFINCACIIETNLSPTALLGFLKKLELKIGRVPSIRNGPRAIDLDILFYNDAVLDTRTADDLAGAAEGSLVIPHPRIVEREFVLRPVCDMVPDLLHPILRKSMAYLLSNLIRTTGQHPSVRKVVPLPDCTGESFLGVPPSLTHWTFPLDDVKGNLNEARQTRIMATLNTTPDSFSDGGANSSLSSALQYATVSVRAGASIIDIGGYSTRPGATFVSEEEESTRLIPVIRSLRQQDGSTSKTPISVDTFRPNVAAAAIKAGANCINDVYAFHGPTPGQEEEYRSEMKRVARKYAVPVVLMHSRGDAGQNKDYSDYEYATHPIIEGVQIELGNKVDSIVLGKGAVRRWLVIVDPGVGFSKTVDGNIQLLKHAKSLTSPSFVGKDQHRRNPLAGYPSLIGTSRKSFLGTILSKRTGQEPPPKDRSWATAAAVSCAVQQNVDILRVHDVVEMVDVVRVSEALYL